MAYFLSLSYHIACLCILFFWPSMLCKAGIQKKLSKEFYTHNGVSGRTVSSFCWYSLCVTASCMGCEGMAPSWKYSFDSDPLLRKNDWVGSIKVLCFGGGQWSCFASVLLCKDCRVTRLDSRRHCPCCLSLMTYWSVGPWGLFPCSPVVVVCPYLKYSLSWENEVLWIRWISVNLLHLMSLTLLLLLFSGSVMSDSATPWTAARQASLSITNSRSLLKLMSI